MTHNRQFSGSWRALRKLSYVGLLWMSICFVAFRVSKKGVPSEVSDYKDLQRRLLEAGLDFEIAPPKPKKILEYTQGHAIDQMAKGLLPTYPTDREVKIEKGAVDLHNWLDDLKENSNIPANYWDPKLPKPPISSKSCVQYPLMYDMHFNNLYWQTLDTKNGSFYLFGAYLDIRERVGKVPLVRVLSMIDRISPPQVYCLLWYENATLPVVSMASYTYAWYAKWGNYKDGFLQPFLVSCPAPLQKGRALYPSSVSLVEQQCKTPENNLRVNFNMPEKKQDFAVCVKGLDFLKEDLSVRLVEWIELLNVLGAKKIFFYKLDVHPNITKVLQYYTEKGIVDVTPLTLPGKMPNLPSLRHQFLKQRMNHKRQNELIPYNDCLYRNLYTYDYLALLDIDEVIMPIDAHGWAALMKEVVAKALRERNYTRASYNFRNVYFMDDMLRGEEMQHEAHENGIPHYMHMLQHVYRAKNYTQPGAFVKCFHNTDRVVTLHNHFPLNCFGTCTTYSVPVPIAQLQHYRKDCVGPLKKSCAQFKNNTVKDTTIWNYKDELIGRVTDTLQTLGFFS